MIGAEALATRGFPLIALYTELVRREVTLLPKRRFLALLRHEALGRHSGNVFLTYLNFSTPTLIAALTWLSTVNHCYKQLSTRSDGYAVSLGGLQFN